MTASPADESSRLPPSAAVPQAILLTTPGTEQPLVDELASTLPNWSHEPIAPGWLSITGPPWTESSAPIVALAQQALPATEWIEAASIRAWVERVGPTLVAAFSQHSGPWRLFVSAHTSDGALVARGRCELIEQGVIDYLRQHQRRLLRTLAANDLTPWHDDEAIVQVVLRTPQAGALSIVLPPERRAWRHMLWPAPSGVAELAVDKRAPSRAFAKLAEAQLWLGTSITAGETCVDLGASPGSWSYWALERGARVTAIDRSPLRDDLMRHPQLTFVRGDAFRYEPPAPVDWLLCDVIAFPQRSIELVERWLARAWCRSFCVTLKFRGSEDYVALEIAKRVLLRSGSRFFLRRLTANKNEVTACGTNRP